MQIVRQSILFFLFCCPIFVSAQTVESMQEILLEYFFLNNEQATEADGQIFLENLEYIAANPIDLNTVGFDEMTSSQLISPSLAQNLISYRQTIGPLISAHELQAIPGWTLEQIKIILPFIEVGNLDARASDSNLWDQFKASKKDILLRYLPKPLTGFPSSGVEGSEFGVGIRFRAQIQGKLRFGILAEKDPGESFFKGSNKQGFDSYIGYLFLKNSPDKRVRLLALGNYQVRLGQGLILYSGLAFGKSPSSTLVLRSGDQIGPFTSFSEGLAMRGAAATIRMRKHVEATFFGSYARRDANLSLATDTLGGGQEEIIFTALQTSGLHRTPAEIEDEKVIGEVALGSSVRWTDATTDVSAQAVFFAFDKPWQPTIDPYRRFIFTGDQLLSGSVAYRKVWRNLIPFGETAISDNGGIATVNGVILSPDRKANIALVHRHLARNYQNIYANPFADGSSGNNESGLYLGVELRPKKGWQFNAYMDLWRNPWLRFNADLPTAGHDYLVRVAYTKKRSFNTYLQLQSKTRQQNVPSDFEGDEGIIGTNRTGLRLHVDQTITPQLTMRSRIEHSWFKYEGYEQSKGYLAYTEVVYKRTLSVPIAFSARYALFDVATSENRIYSYEQDVTAAFSVPALSGRGSRAYLNLRYFIRRGLTLEGRISRTFFTSTVTESQELGNNYFYRVQLRFDW